MSTPRTRTAGSLRLVLIDDPGDLNEAPAGSVLICGAPATLRNARALLRHAPVLVVLHDAGVGMDEAGIAGLTRLAAFHVPAVAVAHDSARVGDADDVLQRGRVAHLNESARAAGFAAGPLAAQIDAFAAAAEDAARERVPADRAANEEPAGERGTGDEGVSTEG